MTNIKKLVHLPFFLLFSFSQKVFSQNSLIGKWMDSDHKEKKIEMYLGSDKTIDGKSEQGKMVFKFLVFDAQSKTYRGILINPDNDEGFNIVIKQPTANSFIFSVKKFIFSKKFTFIRQL